MMTAGMGGLGATVGGAAAWLTGAGAAAAAPVAAATVSTGTVAGIGTAATAAIVGAGHYLDRKGSDEANGDTSEESGNDSDDDVYESLIDESDYFDDDSPDES